MARYNIVSPITSATASAIESHLNQILIRITFFTFHLLAGTIIINNNNLVFHLKNYSIPIFNYKIRTKLDAELNEYGMHEWMKERNKVNFSP